jgi:hypothetical protein
MPKEWTDIKKIFSNKGSISAKSDIAVRVVEAWQQEAKDLCLVLSRLTNTIVSEKLQVRHLKDPTTRTKADIKTLLDEQKLESQFEITDAAAPIDVKAHLLSKSIHVGMTITAPGDKKSSKARLNWLLRQLKERVVSNCYIQANWPGSSVSTVHEVSELVNNPDLISQDKEHLTVISFWVFGSYQLGGRFAQLSNFISDLEAKVPEFYGQVGQNLNQWKRSPPKINSATDDVDVEAIAREAEEY